MHTIVPRTCENYTMLNNTLLLDDSTTHMNQTPDSPSAFGNNKAIDAIRNAYKNRTIRIIMLTALIAVPHLIAYIAMFPGFIQADHQSLIAHIAVGTPTQWHSLLWGYLAYPLLYLSPSYGIYGLAQTAIFVICAVYAIIELNDMALLSHRASIVLAAIFAFCPTYLLYNQLYASDIVFAYVLIPLTIHLIKITVTKGAILSSTRFDISLLILLFVTFSLRKNALLVPLILFPVLLLAYRKHWRRLLVCCVIFVASAVAISTFWTNIIKATPSPSQEMLSVPAQQIARTYATGGEVPDDVNEDLSKIRTPQQWAESYLEYNADPEKMNLSLTPTFVYDWATLGLHNPRTYVDAYAGLMHPFWQLNGSVQSLGIDIDFEEHPDFTNTTCKKECDPHYTAQIEAAYSPNKERAAHFQETMLNLCIPVISDALILFFFNRAIPLYVFAIGLVYSIRKGRGKDFLIATIPLICVLLSLLCFAPVASFRYAFQAFGMLPVIVFFMRSFKKAKPFTKDR